MHHGEIHAQHIKNNHISKDKRETEMKFKASNLTSVQKKEKS